MSADNPRTTRHGTIIPENNDTDAPEEDFDFGNNEQSAKRNKPRYSESDPRGFRTSSNPFYGERDIMDDFQYNEDEQ